MENGIDAVFPLDYSSQLETPIFGRSSCAPSNTDGEGIQTGHTSYTRNQILESLLYRQVSLSLI